MIFVVAGWLSFKLLAMGLNTSRALEEAEVADRARAADPREHGPFGRRASLGKGAASLMKRGKKKGAAGRRRSAGRRAAPSTPAPAPAAGPGIPPRLRTARPAPHRPPAADDDVTVDKAARVLGSMVGKRLADRRKDTE